MHPGGQEQRQQYGTVCLQRPARVPVYEDRLLGLPLRYVRSFVVWGLPGLWAVAGQSGASAGNAGAGRRPFCHPDEARVKPNTPLKDHQ